MDNDGPVDLTSILINSLSLKLSDSLPTRHMYPNNSKNPYKELIQSDPFQILGEGYFGLPKEILEESVGTPIQEFFRGVNILITGGTGFIGKVLTEKLVRSVPHLGHIYLLMRAKRGISSQERFEKLLKDKVFSRMKTEVPHYYTKISVIDGDISEPCLGLSSEDYQYLVDTVNVVFHSAADVKLNEPLKIAMASNVLGSRHVLNFSMKLKNLKAHVHVSTAFSQCARRVIDETVPKMSLNYKEILEYVEAKSSEELKEETPRIIQGWPNTYTFSKAVCEDMIQEEAVGLPICIFRPSVVLPTYKEPVRGWTDNFYGPLGIIVGAGHGILHSTIANTDLAIDMVPVDYVVNCMIAAAWKTSIYRLNQTIPVYNFTSKLFSWKFITDMSLSIVDSWPFEKAIWYTSFIPSESQLFTELVHFFLHKIRGICFDKVIELAGGKPRLSKIYQTVENLKPQIAYFTCNSWVFSNSNVTSLWQSLEDEDKRKFYFDVTDIDSVEYFLVSKLGVRYYLLKEEMETIPATRLKHKWLFWAHQTLKIVSGLVVLKLLVILAHSLPI